MNLDDRLRTRLAALEHQGLSRQIPAITDREGVRYRLDGRPVVGFCSNDYLGLAQSSTSPPAGPRGAGASRLISGDHDEHRTLEARLAGIAGCEDAVLFPSGFQANVGSLPALVELRDTVFSDRLAHASLIDGLRLCRARTTVLPHGTAPPNVGGPSPSWWVVETIYSMDGDRLDLAGMRRHLAGGGWAYVDEAHAIGLFEAGRGLLAAHDIQPTALVGTLSKAYGCAGAFVAGSATLCHWLRTRARSFVFSTGISPVLARSIHDAIDLVQGPEGHARRARLWSNARRFLQALDRDEDPPSPITPIVVGDNEAALEFSAALLQRGWHVQPIRPPTVPTGTARLRITVSAAHEPEQIDALASDLRQLAHARDIVLRIERGREAPDEAA